MLPGKTLEFEKAVKWMNIQRDSSGVGHFVLYGTGGVGYDNPVYVEMIGAKNQEDFVTRIGVLSDKMASPMKEYRSRIYSLTREMKEYDWWMLPGLSYKPAGN